MRNVLCHYWDSSHQCPHLQLPNSPRRLTECQRVKGGASSWEFWRILLCFLLGRHLGTRHTTSLAGLKKGFDQKQKSWLEIEAFLWLPQGILLAPLFLSWWLSWAHIFTHWREERERESEKGWGGGQLPTIDLYFTPATSPRKRKYEGPGCLQGTGQDLTC